MRARIFGRGGALLLALSCCLMTSAAAAAPWRDSSDVARLGNQAIEASFRAGLLVQVKDRATGRVLLGADPDRPPAKLPLFGPKPIDLDACEVSEEIKPDAVISRIRHPDGVELELRWSIEPGEGDLILKAAARSPEPVPEMRIIFFACDIADHDLVCVDCSGVGQRFSAGWEGTLVGDPEKDGSPFSVVPPLLALFQGEKSGWLLEGRDPKIGPSLVMARGCGKTANISMNRTFPVPTKAPEMYEIRLRVYRDRWENGVDPYIRWMEGSAGFIPLERKSPDWVKQIRNQAYINVGDFAGLDALAKRVDPARTLVGRQYGFRKYADPTHCPNYELSDTAKRWFRHGRDLGFHMGAGYSTFAVSPEDPELVERFRPGFAIIGTGKDGNKLYHKLPPDSPSLTYFYYCSAALKPYRDYLIRQMGYAVEAGADLIYLDEASWPSGAMVVDGVDGVQGLMMLEREILQAYPNVALETEQFNPMSSRHASFALTQMFAGHPLGGYIFHRFIHIVPEGIVSAPTEDAYLEAFQSYGYIVPAASREETWLSVVRAFEDYDLRPDGRLTPPFRRALTADRSGGLVPATQPHAGTGSVKLFGYRGRDGTTAYFERHPNRRGLVVYEPGRPPRWFGARVFGVSRWTGPGTLKEWLPGVETEIDWIVYDGATQLGLEPAKTYRLDGSGTHPADRFHVTAVPADFALFERQPSYWRAQDVARDGSFCKLTFTGHGVMRMYVPEGVLVYLDGRAVPVDRHARSAQVQADASKERPSVLLAFVPADAELKGALAGLGWQTSPMQRPSFVRKEGAPDGGSFISGISGIIVLNGKLPQAKALRLRGGYRMRDETHVANSAEGVIRVNGQEVVRLESGQRPFKARPFDVDLAPFAGQHVLIELIADGLYLAAPGEIEWLNPGIEATP